VLHPAAVIMLVVLGAVGALIGWRRGTKLIHRRSLSEPNLAPGETKRDYDRRVRRRRKVWRLVGTLIYGLIGVGIGLLLLAATTMRR
jgi:hypothetical protein